MMSNILLISLLLVIPLISAVAGRAHGSASENSDGSPTGWPSWDRIPSTLWIGLIMGVGNYVIYDTAWLAIILGGLSMAGFATGHGRVFNMQGVTQPAKPERLERLFGWLWPWPIDQPAYSWYIMGLKGLFIGLAIAPVGFLMFFLWPLSYYWSTKCFRDTAPAEWASCAFAGYLVSLVIAIHLLGA